MDIALNVRNLFTLSILIILSACTQTPPLDITPAQKARFSDPFMETLRNGYLEFHQFELSRNNKEKARVYARKALAISRGMVPEMDSIFDRDISLDQLNTLLGAKYFTESAFVNGTKQIDPSASAQAQLMFDCWADQEETLNKQNSQEAETPCQKEFNKARARLEGALLELKRQEYEHQQSIINEEKRRLAAYHKQQLSHALAMQKKELKKLPEYSLIFFKFNSTKLGVTGKGILDKVAKDIRLFKPRKVIISGNTDLIGSYDYNMKLAMARGNVVADYLIKKHGIDRKQLDVKAYGENNPRIDTKQNAKELRNRYVQIIFEMDNKFYLQ